MRYRNLSRYTLSFFIAFLFAVTLSIGGIRRYLSDHIWHVAQGPASFIYGNLSSLRLTATILAQKDKSQQIINLQQENSDLKSQLAGLQDIKNENDFLRQSLNLPSKLTRNPVYAKIFFSTTTPAGNRLYLNQGSKSGIAVGDAVIDERGVLIGQIQEVFSDTSLVKITTDSGFTIHARIFGGVTLGIAKGSGDGLTFDFISQSDPIKEGDLIISSGNDNFMAGLIIGRVDHVDNNETQLFKKIHIHGAFQDIALDRVLVLTN